MINRQIICFVFSSLISNHKLIYNYDIRYEELQGISLYWDFYIYVKPLLRIMQSINQNAKAYLIPSTSVASKFPRPCVLDLNIMYVWLLILCRDETWNNEAWESLGNLISEKWRALEGWEVLNGNSGYSVRVTICWVNTEVYSVRDVNRIATTNQF